MLCKLIYMDLVNKYMRLVDSTFTAQEEAYSASKRASASPSSSSRDSLRVRALLTHHLHFYPAAQFIIDT